MENPTPIAPIEITHHMSCPFKLKSGTKHVCNHCGKQRLDPVHGAISYQRFAGSGGNRFVYQKMKKAWEDAFLKLLADSDLPQCQSIEVMGLICFPDQHKRDEDNFRYLFSKFLGDALQIGGYLRNDDWASYRFRELDLAPPEPGHQWTRLILNAMV